MLYKAHTLILLCIVVNKALVSAEDIPAADDIEPKVCFGSIGIGYSCTDFLASSLEAGESVYEAISWPEQLFDDEAEQLLCTNLTGTPLQDSIPVVKSNGCKFCKKVTTAANAGAVALLLYPGSSEEIDEIENCGVNLHVVSVSQAIIKDVKRQDPNYEWEDEDEYNEYDDDDEFTDEDDNDEDNDDDDVGNNLESSLVDSCDEFCNFRYCGADDMCACGFECSGNSGCESLPVCPSVFQVYVGNEYWKKLYITGWNLKGSEDLSVPQTVGFGLLFLLVAVAVLGVKFMSRVRAGKKVYSGFDIFTPRPGAYYVDERAIVAEVVPFPENVDSSMSTEPQTPENREVVKETPKHVSL
mmetsp:Transcript_6270/g.7628  ORF Transcript_6270/g.7628 Transcript_6270/m.7628 type:complete len:356 (-) Transcript_6270:132-1199(-)